VRWSAPALHSRIVASLVSICPRPVSMAMTRDAPCCNKQSVKPPVEAPTSTQVFPLTSIPSVQALFELQSAAADVAQVFAEQTDAGVIKNRSAGFFDFLLVY